MKTPESRAIYEDFGANLQREYQIEYERVCNAIDALTSARDELMRKASVENSATRKKVSPYKVFKRERAAEAKLEYPNMSNEERQIIIKGEWHGTNVHERGMFVAKARLEEEKSYYHQVKNYFDERIATARKEAPLPDLMLLFGKLTLQQKEVDSKPITQAETSLADTL